MGIDNIGQTPSVFSSFTVNRTAAIPYANSPLNQNKQKDLYLNQKNKAKHPVKLKKSTVLFSSVGAGAIIIGSAICLRMRNSRQMKEIVEDLQDRLNAAVVIVQSTENKAATLTKKTSDELSPFLRRPHLTSTALTVMPTALRKRPVSELLTAEENQFVEITSNFNDILDEIPENIEKFAARFATKKDELITGLNQIVSSGKKKIQELTQDLPEVTQKKKAKKMVEKFHSNLQKISQQLDSIIPEQAGNFDAKVGAHYGFVSELGEFMEEKISRLTSIISDTMGAIKGRANSPPQAFCDEVDEAFMDVIPSSLPQSILQSHFLRFTRNVKTENPQEFIKSVNLFTQEMSNKFSIKDIDIMIARLKLREESIPVDAEWYNMTRKKMQLVRSAIEKVLFNNLKNSGKKIDPESLSEDDIQTIITVLQEQSDKMGYGSIRKMMTPSSIFEKDYRNAEIIRSPIFKLYQKILPYIKDSGTYYEEILK